MSTAHASRHAPSAAAPVSGFFGVFRYSSRALLLVWQTSRLMMVGLALATLVAGVLPAVAAWVGQLIVDGVVAAMEAQEASAAPPLAQSLTPVLWLVALEGAIIGLIALAQRGLDAQKSLLVWIDPSRGRLTLLRVIVLNAHGSGSEGLSATVDLSGIRGLVTDLSSLRRGATLVYERGSPRPAGRGPHRSVRGSPTGPTLPES
ncbi:hypothetical protein [Halomonas piscis]|nr:hypothetical protein [Halomonas piscis]